ncbi:putative protein disulfide-isomerase [Toxoplasma gondii GT1]|uniref:protein disulfide-isomerase n=9 Tax=Toxoplasma gondii TaxID=5811 RepID=B9PQF6_TOXGV|nr:putative protein disulfide-isomerase [Toxoplasma gondii GT1]ESS28840.1 putative protein disulfide-isomerase [Toxoplasma gondii VEG]KAF4638285.1 putative protein disulfide-isomerase [Toxoplasma gondii]KFG37962.1 putative protein disulfide-isomerase [Toxoplasma gondii p89]KFG50746.1 putative protein disulfide-isomerase [Toxoplasma gondii FOU]PUA88725.1 putative protein disulfide-isomerase [Toxoplasma gondii TgCATBr9]RQX71746.1 putative protein disulfide-isomerase [Toxoplasma gondii CAST]
MVVFRLTKRPTACTCVFLIYLFTTFIGADPGAAAGDADSSGAPQLDHGIRSSDPPVTRLIYRADGAAKALKLAKRQSAASKDQADNNAGSHSPAPVDHENLSGCTAEEGCSTTKPSGVKRKPEMLSTSVMSRGAISLTDDNYHDFMEAHSIVLVLYYAPWCYWSQRTSPEFDAAARVLAHDKTDPPVFLAKVDCTQHTQVMRKEDIQEYPTLKFFMHGHPKEYTGGRKRAEILKWLQENLDRDRIITSVNALEEVLASRQLGTLVVIAAQELPATSSVQDGDSASSGPSSTTIGGQISEESVDPASMQRALRLGRVQTGSNSEVNGPAQVSTAGNTASPPGGSLNRRVRTAGHSRGNTANQKDLLITSSDAAMNASKQLDRETFVKVSRMVGSDVLFGEIAEPEVLQYYLDIHVKPYMRTRLDMAHIHLPFIAAFPSRSDSDDFEDRPSSLMDGPGGEDVAIYTGSFTDQNSLIEFVQTHKFPPALPFTGIVAPRLFEDGRPICVMFLDDSSSVRRNGHVHVPTERTAKIRKIFEDVASSYRSQLIFTVSGTKEPHEKRLLTLLGVEDDHQGPQLRIVTFNPSGNGKYYPALKFRPVHMTFLETGSSRDTTEGTSSKGNKSMERMPAETDQGSDSRKTGLRSSVSPSVEEASLETRRESPSRKEGPRSMRSQSVVDGNALQEFKENIKNFVASYLDGSLTPYLRSEPAPAEEDNQSVLKVLVGSTFNGFVLQTDKDVLVEFGAPWCGHCRKVEPTLKMVAAVLRDSGSELVVAKMDATRNEVKDLYFTGYPTLLLFPANRKTDPIMYRGDRSEEDLLQWLATNADRKDINLELCRERIKKLLEQQRMMSSGPISESGEPLMTSWGTLTHAERSVLEEL